MQYIIYISYIYYIYKYTNEQRGGVVQGPLHVVVVLEEDHTASLASNEVHAAGIRETNATHLEVNVCVYDIYAYMIYI